jgi:hypothetical protein
MNDFDGNAQKTYEILRAMVPDGVTVGWDHVRPSQAHQTSHTLHVGPEIHPGVVQEPYDFTIDFHPGPQERTSFSGRYVEAGDRYDILQILAIIRLHYAHEQAPEFEDLRTQARTMLREVGDLLRTESRNGPTSDQLPAVEKARMLVDQARLALNEAAG